MFEYAFVEARGRSVRPGTFMASLAGELGVIGVAILLPLVFVDGLPQAAWMLQHVPLVGPPPARPLTEAPMEVAAPARTPKTAAREARLYEPVKYPRTAAILVDPDPGPPAAGSGAGPGVAYGLGDPAAALHPALADTLRLPAPAAPPVKVELPVAEVATPPLLRIGGRVQPPAPLYTPAPQYPALARQSRVEGVVNLEAIIATDGTIRSVKLVKGHVLLTAAAIAAVRQWRYTAPALNGEPIELLMYVDVTFKLNR